MDELTLLLIGFLYLLVAYYHREEKRKGNEGIPIFGPIFCDTFWSLIEAFPNGEQATGWLDKKIKVSFLDLILLNPCFRVVKRN
jgi:hypothetical protein